MRFFLQDIDDQLNDKGGDNVRLLSPQQKMDITSVPMRIMMNVARSIKHHVFLILWRSKYNYIGSNVYHMNNYIPIPRDSL